MFGFADISGALFGVPFGFSRAPSSGFLVFFSVFFLVLFGGHCRRAFPSVFFSKFVLVPFYVFFVLVLHFPVFFPFVVILLLRFSGFARCHFVALVVYFVYFQVSFHVLFVVFLCFCRCFFCRAPSDIQDKRLTTMFFSI